MKTNDKMKNDISKIKCIRAGKLTHKTVLILILPAVVMSYANAGEFTVGLGAAATTSPYISDKKNKVEAGVLPILTYEGERLKVGMGDISYELFQLDDIDVSAIASARSAEFDSTINNSGSFDSKNKKLAGMKKRKTAFELGVGMSYREVINLSAMADVSGAHKGYELDASATLPIPYGKLVVAPSVGLNFQSKGLVNYNYGVSKKESRAGRPQYQPKASLNPYLGVMAVYPVTKKVNFLMGGQYQLLGDAVKDSPIVDKDYTASAFSAFTYTF